MWRYIDQNTKGQSKDLEVPFFSLATMATSTDNFSNNNKLGEGGFGLVYKVNLPYDFIKAIEKVILIIFNINKTYLQMWISRVH